MMSSFFSLVMRWNIIKQKKTMTNNTLTIKNRSSLYWALKDSGVLIVRSLKHIFKNIDQMMSLVFQPIMFLLLFRYVFGGAINTGGTSYVNYLVAGILIQMAAFGATTTSFNIAMDMKRGIIDRFRSLPMSNATVLIGHVVADLARNIMSSIVMLSVGLLVGFRPTATFKEWIFALGMLLLFTLAISWLSAILGLLAKSVEAVQWMSFMIIFPLTFASSAFVPTEGMPRLLRAFAENQPVTHVIEAMRGYMVGTPIGNHALIAIIWFVSIIIVSVPLSGFLFRRLK
ncbi:MAG TPA: ABC transporter permease [Candidatus Paceibacterota bacterium]|nr:ABC transporter permease [Candidatus Paceibacterota bacterium]